MTEDAKYEEWKNNRKRLLVEYDSIIKCPNGEVIMSIRADEGGVAVGDIMGNAKVLKTEAYGKSLDKLCSGMTGAVTFDKMPYLNVEETFVCHI